MIKQYEAQVLRKNKNPSLLNTQYSILNTFKTMMKSKEMREAIRIKNELLIRQKRRIELMEDKMTELKKKYFHLKYPDIILHLKGSI